MNKHHIWCKWVDKSPDTCEVCAILQEKYPQITNDPDGLLLTQKYFPDVMATPKKKIKHNIYVDTENIMDNMAKADFTFDKRDNLKQAVVQQ